MAEYTDYFVIPMFSKAYPTPCTGNHSQGYKSSPEKPMFVTFTSEDQEKHGKTVATTKQILTGWPLAPQEQRVDGIISSRESTVDTGIPEEAVADKETRNFSKTTGRRSSRSLSIDGIAVLGEFSISSIFEKTTTILFSLKVLGFLH